MPPSLCSGGMCCRDFRGDVRLWHFGHLAVACSFGRYGGLHSGGSASASLFASCATASFFHGVGIPIALGATMTQYNPNSTTSAAASSHAIEDLNGTEKQLNLAGGQTAAASEGVKTAVKEPKNAKAAQSTKEPKKAKAGKSAKKPADKLPAKAAALIFRPSQTIEQAIVSGVPPKELDKLLREWKAYNLYQAEIKAKVDNDALANAIEERRRKIAEELLEYVNGQGLSVAEARRMLTDASEADGGEDPK